MEKLAPGLIRGGVAPPPKLKIWHKIFIIFGSEILLMKFGYILALVNSAKWLICGTMHVADFIHLRN
jgi:hypothetical protein